MPVSALSGGLTTATTSAAAPDNSMGKDAFLKLLVAQLKYQDPMKPSNSSEFMAQTAQFTMVEKLEELAKQNAELLANNRTLGASALIGRQVVTVGPDGADVVATVTGVRLDPNGTVLKTGDTEVSLAGVKEVRAAGS